MSKIISVEINNGKDMTKIIEELKVNLGKKGFTINGNEKSGNFIGKTLVGTFLGTYSVNCHTINITMSKKPFIIPWATVARTVKNYKY